LECVDVAGGQEAKTSDWLIGQRSSWACLWAASL